LKSEILWHTQGPHTGVYMISMNRCLHIISTTFTKFWLYELETYIVCIEQNSVKFIQEIFYFNWMHDIFLNTLTQFIKKFYICFNLFLLPFSKLNKQKSLIFPKFEMIFFKWSLLSLLQAKYVRPLLTNTLLNSMILCPLQIFFKSILLMTNKYWM